MTGPDGDVTGAIWARADAAQRQKRPKKPSKRRRFIALDA